MDAVLNWLWQGGVVAAAWCVMLLALRRARANVRYAGCWAASLLVVALPALSSLTSTAAAAGAFPAATQVDAVVSLPDAWWTSALVMLGAWMLWIGLHVARFVSAVVAIRRARARSRAFPSHAESALAHWRRVRSGGRRATLVLSDAVETAAVLGWGAPMIAVAPSLVRTLDADELDRVLIHEWAHVQRRDDLVNVLQVAVRAVAGWHPALWWIDRRLHLEREIACDETTVAITGSPKSYAACLVKLASLRGTSGAMRMAPAVLTPSGLRARVIRIVSPHPSLAPAWSRSIAAAMVTTLCVMSAALGGLNLVEATALALPLVSPRTLGATLDRPAPVAVAAVTPDGKAKRPSRRAAGRALPPQRFEAQQPSRPPEQRPEPDAPPPTTDAATTVDPAPAAEAGAGPAVGEVASAAPTPANPPAAIEKDPQSPWTAAAAGGAAIGRKSKDAGVATAGFFTRFARRVAGSF